jgi:hypothetical protein
MNDRASTQLPEIIRDFTRPSPELVKQASQYAASILADVAGRRGALDGRIAPLTRSTRLAGTAFTVEVRPGDNLMIHAAMQLAKPGDVLVIDGKGDTTCALMGTIMMTACRQLGITGVVMDSAVRDSEEIVEMGFPVYSVGTESERADQVRPGPHQPPGERGRRDGESLATSSSGTAMASPSSSAKKRRSCSRPPRRRWPTRRRESRRSCRARS